MSTDAEQKMEIRITRVEDRQGRMENEFMDFKAVQDEIRSLAITFTSLANDVKHIADDLRCVVQRVDKMESKPARRWDLFVQAIITAGVGGLIGYMIAMILK